MVSFSLTLGAGLFIVLWCIRDQYGKLWVPDWYRSPSPRGALGIDDYFYLNVRSMSQGGKFSL
jgi:hypothetical protein